MSDLTLSALSGIIGHALASNSPHHMPIEGPDSWPRTRKRSWLAPASFDFAAACSAPLRPFYCCGLEGAALGLVFELGGIGGFWVVSLGATGFMSGATVFRFGSTVLALGVAVFTFGSVVFT